MSYLKSFERLEKLHKVDLGFYVLGLHSFMESYIKDVTGQSSDYFLDSLFSYNSYLSRKSKPELHRNFISKLKVDHINTNKVRHDFSQIFSTDAESSTHNFITFLKKSEIDPIDYNGLRTILDSWDYRINTGESEAKKLQLELLKAKEKITKLEVEVGDSRNISNQLELLEKEKAVLDHKLKSKNESLDVLKEDKIVLESKIQELSGSTENTKALEDYIHYLSRFSLYTRTRADYEKSVLKLSVPQKEAINRITLKKISLLKVQQEQENPWYLLRH
ncbi:hypothetical protein [Thiospirochaeta perfilievii]|uniref:hypothetical protein n=1 Tax=Thiospirochaeta perfilievii TaxID=252967 RepID=UPI001659A3FC|nr:hypothetical protein [Thiospirochaeta perfilievii]